MQTEKTEIPSCDNKVNSIISSVYLKRFCAIEDVANMVVVTSITGLDTRLHINIQLLFHCIEEQKETESVHTQFPPFSM